MHRRTLLGCLAAVSAAEWTGCKRRPAPASSVRIRVTTVPQLSMSGLYLARERGYFANAGLDVEIQETSSGQVTVLLAGGGLDVGFNGVGSSFLNAVARGAPLRIVAGRQVLTPSCSNVDTLYGSRRSFPRGLDDLKQLKGKRVAISSRANVSEFFLDAVLEKAGLRSEDVRVMAVRRPEAVAALIGGKIDAMIDHYIDRAPSSFSPQIVRGIRMSEILPGFQFSHVIFGARLLRENPETGARFLRAYLRGAREYLRGSTPNFVEQYTRANNLDPELVRQSCRNTFTPDGGIRMDDLQRFVDWAIRRGYCQQPVRAAQLVDSRFLALARQGESQ